MHSPFDDFDESVPEESDSWRWATVTSANPLRIRLDQAPEPLPIDPINLAGELAEGARVWVQLHRSHDMQGGAVIVHGSGRGKAWRRLWNAQGEHVTDGTVLTGWDNAPGAPNSNESILKYGIEGPGTISPTRPGVFATSASILYSVAATGLRRELRLLVDGVQHETVYQNADSTGPVSLTLPTVVLHLVPGQSIAIEGRVNGDGLPLHTREFFNVWSIYEV